MKKTKKKQEPTLIKTTLNENDVINNNIDDIINSIDKEIKNIDKNIKNINKKPLTQFK